MTEDHRPRPEFESNLEWQVRTALRRADRFSDSSRPSKGGRMQMASLVLVSALLGAGGVVVNDEVQENRAQEARLVQVEMEMRLAGMELELAQAQVEEAERQVQAGLVEDEALLSARDALREAEVRMAMLGLNREEIRVTGLDPNDALDAPVVQGRDFVSERLVMEIELARGHMEAMERQMARLEQLRDAGMITERDAMEGSGPLEEAVLQMDALAQKLQLRDRFVAGEISAPDAVREALLVEARMDLQLHEQAVQQAAAALERLEDLASRGMIQELDVKRARLEALQQEMASDMVRLRLQELMRGGGGGR